MNSKLNIINTLTGKKENFVPIDEKKVGMYVCGPTVYDFPHVGNARPLVVFDVLFRILIKIFGKDKVTYVRNITDIDDKIINSSKDKKISIDKLTSNVTKSFHDDCKYLNCLKPNFEPKATEHIKGMIEMTENLLKNQHAYEKDKHIYFSVNSFKNYGKLSKKNPEELVAGARVEVSKLKQNPLDFVLWKPSLPNDPGWDSPWGRGRPGWHLECSVMSEKFLGKNFDIHGGGLDLVFPHHENEIAQSEAFSENVPFSTIWMHNGLINLKSEKMSKSLGNIISINDLLKKYSPAAIRMFFISGNYKNPLEYDESILNANEKAIQRLKQTIQLKSSDSVNELNSKQFVDKFHKSMNADLNTSLALGSIFELSKSINQSYNQNININKSQNNLLELLSTLGIDIKSDNIKPKQEIDTNKIEKLIKDRNEFRKNKNYTKADEIRDELDSMGITIYDSEDETKWRSL